MKKKARKGQSILEYTLILGVVIAIIAAFLFKSGGMKDKVDSTYGKAGSAISSTASDATIGVFQGATGGS